MMSAGMGNPAPDTARWRWWFEEELDRHLETAGERNDVVGTELTDAYPVNGAFRGGERRLGPPDTHVRFQLGGCTLLGPATQSAGLAQMPA